MIKVFICIAFAMFYNTISTANDDFFENDVDVIEEDKIFYDPLEPFNRKSFWVMKNINKFALSPISSLYDKTVPKPLHPHIQSLTDNIKIPISTVSSAFIPNKTPFYHGFSRFVFNTFFGFGGFFDYHSQYSAQYISFDADDVFQYYSKKPLPYLVMPMFFGNIFSSINFVQKFAYNSSLETFGYETETTILNFGSFLTSIHANQAQIDDVLNNSLDPYAIMRNFYYQLQDGKIQAIRSEKYVYTRYSNLIPDNFNSF